MKKTLPKKHPKAHGKSVTDTISGATLLSHQLMSTLTAMKWSLKMLREGDFGAMSKEQKDIMGKIDQCNDLLISLADRVLHTSKLEDEKYCCNQGLVNIESIVNSTMEYCKEGAGTKNIVMEFKKPAKRMPALIADEEMLKIAIQNIFDNAIKYTPMGGKIKISLNSNGRNIELGVQDSGIGVPQKQRKGLFHKFFRADNAVKLNPVGSGLGLFICKNIVQAHHGKIWFDSKENEGSTFYISLPAQAGLPVKEPE